MKICVDKVLNETIWFSTNYGEAKGIWKGSNRPVQKECYVELDFASSCNYDDIIVSETKEYQMRILDGSNQITLLLLEYDKGGCATFRLGNSIIEAETEFDERFYGLMNKYVTLNVETLFVYDENL